VNKRELSEPNSDSLVDNKPSPAIIAPASLIQRGIGIHTPTPTGGSTANPDFGSCPDPTLKGGVGLKPGAPDAFAFVANDTTKFPHPGALDPSVITVFICNSFNRCGANAAAHELCALAIIPTSNIGKTGKETAVDAFNKGLGFQ
jgi:hypothetical protein